jgi:hypothetical protein
MTIVPAARAFLFNRKDTKQKRIQNGLMSIFVALRHRQIRGNQEPLVLNLLIVHVMSIQYIDNKCTL